MGNKVTMSVELLDGKFDNVFTKLEACGRICYNSESKMEEGTAIPYIEKLLKAGHESVIEHDGMVFYVADQYRDSIVDLITSVSGSTHLKISEHKWKMSKSYIISGNFRAWRDHYRASFKNPIAATSKAFMSTHLLALAIKDFGISKAAQGISYMGLTSQFRPNSNIDLEMKHLTATFRIDNVSRVMTHQLVRHRPCAFSQRSQRWCNESDLKYVMPPTISEHEIDVPHNTFNSAIIEAKNRLNQLYEMPGVRKDDARFVLPNATATNIVMTATLNQWRHIITLRTSDKASWEIRDAMKLIYQQLKERYDFFPEIETANA